MKLKTIIFAASASLIASATHAQKIAVAVQTDTIFILSSLLFLMGGFLVFWMVQAFSC